MKLRLNRLKSIPFAFVVTQNWDCILEKKAHYTRVAPSHLNDYRSFLEVLQEPVSLSRQRTVLKFESDGYNSESFLLSQEEIQKVTEEDGEVSGRAFWRELLRTHAVVFL